jgi:hypothetical protein
MLRGDAGRGRYGLRMAERGGEFTHDTFRALPLEWELTGDTEFPYRCRLDGALCRLRLNDFPAEPLYSLMIDGTAVADLEEWPAAWLRPADPDQGA